MRASRIVIVACLATVSVLAVVGANYCSFSDLERLEARVTIGPWSVSPEACSLGFWKNHVEEWPYAFCPDTPFADVFEVDLTGGATLLQALELGGGGEVALARQAVASLLNAAHPDVSFDLTTARVVDIVQTAVASGQYEAAKDELEGHNHATGGCPLEEEGARA